MKRLLLSGLSFVLVLACSAAAATSSLAGTIHKRHDLADVILAVVAAGAVAVVRHGGHTDAAAVGYANLASRTPITRQDKVRIGSVTKTFVAVVAFAARGGPPDRAGRHHRGPVARHRVVRKPGHHPATAQPRAACPTTSTTSPDVYDSSFTGDSSRGQSQARPGALGGPER
jgi:hypothetical protein